MIKTPIAMSLPPALEYQVERAVALLRSGGVVVFPTDTLYGLGAHVLQERAVERVFRIKGRRENLALPLLLPEVAELRRVAVDIPPLGWCLAHRFWPGALTLVVRRAPVVPLRVTGGKETVAVRLPSHPVPRELARRLGAPITGTSANLSGTPSPTTAEAVRAALGDQVDLIIDGGPCHDGVPSTVLDLTGEVPRILRQGPVSMAALQQVCGQVEAV